MSSLIFVVANFMFNCLKFRNKQQYDYWNLEHFHNLFQFRQMINFPLLCFAHMMISSFCDENIWKRNNQIGDCDWVRWVL